MGATVKKGVVQKNLSYSIVSNKVFTGVVMKLKLMKVLSNKKLCIPR